MGLIRIAPAVVPYGAFEAEMMTPTSAATIALGEPVQRNAGNPEQIEAFAGGATVTGLVGFAAGIVTAGTPEFGTKILVYKANANTQFIGQIYDVSAGALATAAAATHEGNNYGLVEPTAGEWYVDEEDTGDVHVTVTRVLTGLNACLFRVISTVIGV